MLTYRDISKILDHFKSNQGLFAWLLEIIWYGKSQLMTYLEALAQHSQLCPQNTALTGTDLSALFSVLASHSNTNEGKIIIDALNRVIRTKKLSDKPTPLSELFKLLNMLILANIRTDNNVAALFSIIRDDRGSVVELLFQADMLTQQRFDIVLQNPNIDGFSLQALYNLNLLNDFYFKKISARKEQSKSFSYAILYLKEFKLLTRSNLDKLLVYPTPEAIEVLFLIGSNLLKQQQNLDVLFSRPEIGLAAKLIWQKQYRKIKMTQEDFNYHVGEVPVGARFVPLSEGGDMYAMLPPASPRKSRLRSSDSSDMASGSETTESFHTPKKSPTATPMPSPKSSPLLFASTGTEDADSRVDKSPPNP